MFEYISNNRVKFIALAGQHLSLALCALALCFLIGVAAGALCFKNRAFNVVATSAASSLRVVPSIAVMLLLMPLMGTGFLPAITALTILGLPPVMINTARALESIESGVIEAAEACAMTGRVIFWRIRLPLAMPMIITGLRISGLSVAAGATLAAYIGAGGLGELILSGLSQFRMDILLAGAVATMAISLSIEGFFQLLYSMSVKRAGKR
jgi:osmoprotectant transport system permease protein